MPSRILRRVKPEAEPKGFVIYDIEQGGTVEMKEIIKELSEVEQAHGLTPDGGLMEALGNANTPIGTIALQNYQASGIKIQVSKKDSFLKDLRDKGYKVIG